MAVVNNSDSDDSNNFSKAIDNSQKKNNEELTDTDDETNLSSSAKTEEEIINKDMGSDTVNGGDVHVDRSAELDESGNDSESVNITNRKKQTNKSKKQNNFNDVDFLTCAERRSRRYNIRNTEGEMEKRRQDFIKRKQLKKKQRLEKEEIFREENKEMEFEQQKFNTYFNKTMRSTLHNPRQMETRSHMNNRIEKSYEQLQNYIDKEYSEANNNDNQPAENRHQNNGNNEEERNNEQKKGQNKWPEVTYIRYEPISEEKEEETFAITYECKGETIVEDWITIAYMEWLLGRVFIGNILKTARKAQSINPNCKHQKFKVPAGNSKNDQAPEEALMRFDSKNRPVKKIHYKQKQRKLCFGYSFANALYHTGLIGQSRIIADCADALVELDSDTQFNKLSRILKQKIKTIIPVSKEKELAGISLEKFLQNNIQCDIMLVIPKGNDGSVNHAVTIANGRIYDSTQEFPLKISKESFDFVCGDCGCQEIYKTKSFNILGNK